MLGNVVKRKKCGVQVVETDKGINIKADEWDDKIKDAIDKCQKENIREFVNN